MSKVLITSLIAILMVAPIAQAGKGHRSGNVHWAKVTDVEAITRSVRYETPVEKCWDERVRYERPGSRESGSYTSTIVGGIVGGAIGNAVGHKKRNKQIGAVVGSVLGASIGHEIGQQDRQYSPGHVSYGKVKRCKTDHRSHFEKEIVGYRVWYRYHGKEYQTRMNRKPGDRIRVRVSVTPF